MVFWATDDEFNEWIRADDRPDATKESTDEEFPERIIAVNGKETVDVDEDDKDEENIPVSDLEAKSIIETLEKYLRQKKDCRSDIGSMKLGEIKLFIQTKTLNEGYSRAYQLVPPSDTLKECHFRAAWATDGDTSWYKTEGVFKTTTNHNKPVLLCSICGEFYH